MDLTRLLLPLATSPRAKSRRGVIGEIVTVLWERTPCAKKRLGFVSNMSLMKLFHSSTSLQSVPTDNQGTIPICTQRFHFLLMISKRLKKLKEAVTWRHTTTDIVAMAFVKNVLFKDEPYERRCPTTVFRSKCPSSSGFESSS